MGLKSTGFAGRLLPDETRYALLDFRARPVDVAFGHKARHQVAVEEESGRQDGDLPGLARGAVAIEQDRKGRRTFSEEAAHATIDLADVHTNDGHVSVTQVSMQLLESGQFGPARFAPGQKSARAPRVRAL